MKCHHTKTNLINAGKGTIFVIVLATISFWVLLFFVNAGIKVYENVTPTSVWYEYVNGTPSPTQPSFGIGEPILIKSDVDRHYGMHTRWEDTAYCRPNSFSSPIKLITQDRPLSGTEYKDKGYYSSQWEYSQDINIAFKECRICGTTIGYTPQYEYRKRRPYCTEWFKVNQ